MLCYVMLCYVCMYVCMYVMYVCIYIYIFIHIYMYVCVYVCMYVCIHSEKYVCIIQGDGFYVHILHSPRGKVNFGVL